MSINIKQVPTDQVLMLITINGLSKKSKNDNISPHFQETSHVFPKKIFIFLAWLLAVVDVHRLEILCLLMTSPHLSPLQWPLHWWLTPVTLDPGDRTQVETGALTRPLLCNSQTVECSGWFPITYRLNIIFTWINLIMCCVTNA